MNFETWIKETEEYIKRLKMLIEIGDFKDGCCSMCGMSPEALQNAINLIKQKDR